MKKPVLKCDQCDYSTTVHLKGHMTKHKKAELFNCN
jgi:hypothetical protein